MYRISANLQTPSRSLEYVSLAATHGAKDEFDCLQEAPAYMAPPPLAATLCMGHIIERKASCWIVLPPKTAHTAVVSYRPNPLVGTPAQLCVCRPETSSFIGLVGAAAE